MISPMTGRNQGSARENAARTTVLSADPVIGPTR